MLIKTLAGSLIETDKLIPKFKQKDKRTRLAKTILKKNNKVGGPDFSLNTQEKSIALKGFLSWWLSGKEPACQCRRLRFDPWVRKTSWRRKWQTTLVFLPGKSCGQKEPGRLQSMGSQKNQTKQQQSRQCGIQVRTNIQYID